jgi:hypothetical protein
MHNPNGCLQISDVGDQGIEARPALGGENLGDGGRIGGVCGQAIDCFCRQDDELAAAQGLGGGRSVWEQRAYLLNSVSITTLT